jgi:uncharacterized protein YcbK (DUF882 family)
MSAQTLTRRRAPRILLEVRTLALALALCAAVPSLAGGSKLKPKPKLLPAAELTTLNTHETFTLRPDARGHFGKKELRGWSRFLRCHHTGRVHLMSSRLAELMYQTAQHFEWKPLLIVAGYRAPRIAKKKGNPRSPHKQGVACDFRVDGVANTELRDFLRSAFQRIGVGYYPNSDFVHLDVQRKVSAFWIDYSGPGERAKYSRDPEGDLKSESGPDTEVAGDEPTLPPDPGGDEPQKNSSPGLSAPNAQALNPPTP